MQWNIENIAFLHKPDVFTGSFDIPQMQARHEQELAEKRLKMQNALAAETDPLHALQVLNHKDHIQFLLNNMEEFRHRGRFEEAVIFLYCKENAPFSSGGDAEMWKKFFSLCDRRKLRECGSVVFSDFSRAYRGSVTGFRKSLAWTPEIRRARKFAERWKDHTLGGGEIFEVDISPDDVLVYLQRKSEDMIIVNPDFIVTAVIRPFSG